MIISKRIDWLFANSYIKKNSIISKNNPSFAYAVTIFIYGAIKIAQLYFLQTKHRFSDNQIPNHVVIESATPHMHLNYFRYFNTGEADSGHLIVECFNKYQFTERDRNALSTVIKLAVNKKSNSSTTASVPEIRKVGEQNSLLMK